MFWNNLIKLCSEKGISPNGVCAELGLSNAIATKWKNGSIPRNTTLKRIADFFNVSPEYLLCDAADAAPPYKDGGSYMVNPDEHAIIAKYRKLSDDSKRKIMENIDDLLLIDSLRGNNARPAHTDMPG